MEMKHMEHIITTKEGIPARLVAPLAVGCGRPPWGAHCAGPPVSTLSNSEAW